MSRRKNDIKTDGFGRRYRMFSTGQPGDGHRVYEDRVSCRSCWDQDSVCFDCRRGSEYSDCYGDSGGGYRFNCNAVGGDDD